MGRAAVPWALASVAALLLALSFGFTFPAANQHTYLVHGLALHDPTLFARDWYVHETADYHHAFSLLVSALLAVRDGPVPFWVLDVAFVVLGALAWFSLTRRAFGPLAGTAAWGAWLVLGMLTRTSDVMESYLFGGYLQPSSIGCAGLLWAIALYARASDTVERKPQLGWLAASGGALAIGGAFHVNFLLLGALTLGLAHLAQQRGVFWRRKFLTSLLAQQALPIVVLALMAPLLFEASRGPAAAALPILFEVRAPHHFQPTLAALSPMFAWQAAAWIVIVAHRGGALAVPAVLVRLLAAVGGFVMLASLLSTVLHLARVTQLFPWRMAPIADALALIIVVGTATLTVLRAPPAEPRRRRLARLGAFLLATPLAIYGANVAWPSPERGRLFLMALAAALLVAMAASRLARARARAALAPLLTAAALSLVLTAGALVALREVPLERQQQSKPRRELAAWARRHTAKDALFSVPPDLDFFRLSARRAIIVDWKSAGMLPRDIVEWARRIEESSGVALRDRSAARRGYAAMSAARALALRERYGVDYFVFDKRAAPPPSWAKTVHEGRRYVVLQAPSVE